MRVVTSSYIKPFQRSLDQTQKETYGSFCRIECAPIPYKHRHSERFKVLSCKIELFNSSIGHFAG